MSDYHVVIDANELEIFQFSVLSVSLHTCPLVWSFWVLRMFFLSKKKKDSEISFFKNLKMYQLNNFEM